MIRPFISYIFQDSRKDREVDRLFKVLERVTELKDTELSKTQALADIHLPKLALELQVAESIANKLNHKRSLADGEREVKLDLRRKERATEWDTFVHDMTSKCIRIDKSYKDKQEEIVGVYKKAEEKLLNNNRSNASADTAKSESDSAAAGSKHK
jgi:hypothetical protein